jgi:hypothetical protein
MLTSFRICLVPALIVAWFGCSTRGPESYATEPGFQLQHVRVPGESAALRNIVEKNAPE